eukprot:745702-Hanusia_phi.AAC.3
MRGLLQTEHAQGKSLEGRDSQRGRRRGGERREERGGGGKEREGEGREKSRGVGQKQMQMRNWRGKKHRVESAGKGERQGTRD